MLTFPTMAQTCYDAWHNTSRTIALATVARLHGASVTKSADFDGTVWTYTFDDDTSLVVRGVGKAHKVKVCLP